MWLTNELLKVVAASAKPRHTLSKAAKAIPIFVRPEKDAAAEKYPGCIARARTQVARTRGNTCPAARGERRIAPDRGHTANIQMARGMRQPRWYSPPGRHGRAPRRHATEEQRGQDGSRKMLLHSGDYVPGAGLRVNGRRGLPEAMSARRLLGRPFFPEGPGLPRAIPAGAWWLHPGANTVSAVRARGARPQLPAVARLPIAYASAASCQGCQRYGHHLPSSAREPAAVIGHKQKLPALRNCTQ